MLKIKKTYNVGDRFRDTNKNHKNEEYILAAVGYDNNEHRILVTLISLEDGNRWTDAILVKDSRHISFSDITKLTGSGVFEEANDGKSK